MKHNNSTGWSAGRRSFISMGATAVAGLLGCTSNGRTDSTASTFDGEVLVIGAGPAGMTTAHLLQQRGVSFRVLEAAASAGGRIRHDVEFTDFPIPLGAEWVHVESQILDEILNDPAIDVNTQLQGYDNTVQSGYFDNNTLTLQPDTVFQSDLKFIDSSWFDFFATYILPNISNNVIYNSPVVAIDHSGNRIRVINAAGDTYIADKVVVTAPIKILQRGDIKFNPVLPESKREVINGAKVWSGLKAFIEFDQQFYPTFLYFPDSETNDGQRLYYDAAYGQQTMANILGLFAVGAQAERYQALSHDDLIPAMLGELDTVFDGIATRSYVRHIVKNWNTDPYAGAAYLADVESVQISRILSEPVDDRIYFAGEAYTSFNDWGGVHTATRSAADVVSEILS